MCSKMNPDITLFTLEGSRSIRIAWLLEELGVNYSLISSPRDSNFLAPAEFKKQTGTFLGKSPAIKDHDITIQESQAITEYVCEYYDKDQHLFPKDRALRAKVREFISASEATVMLHGLAIQYGKWHLTDHPEVLDKYVERVSPNVHKDLDWLEHELSENQKRTGGSKVFLVGSDVTAADTMMHVSVQAIFQREMGVKNPIPDDKWQLLRRWVKEMEEREAYQRASDKINFKMEKKPQQ